MWLTGMGHTLLSVLIVLRYLQNQISNYYNLLKAWTAKKDDDFSMINSHEKTAAVRDSSLRETLWSRPKEKFRLSKKLTFYDWRNNHERHRLGAV